MTPRAPVIALVAMCGCGRIGFDSLADPLADGATADVRPLCTTPFSAASLLPGASTPDQDLSPVGSRDGLELIYFGDHPTGLGLSDLWRATRTSTTLPFDPAALIPNVNTASSDSAASLTADGLLLYFSSDRAGGAGMNDLWTASRPDRTSQFSTPVNVAEVNSASREFDAIISPDGLELHFSSDRPGGFGGFDIWVATRASTSVEFDAPVNLTAVNSSKHDNGGWETDNRLLMVFSSSIGALDTETDVFWATRASTSEPWGNVTQVANVNSTAYELGPYISADGETLYFSSSRLGGPGGDDLYFATRTCP